MRSVADLRDAIYHGAVKRVRPKAMTACGHHRRPAADPVEPRHRRRRDETHRHADGRRRRHLHAHGTARLSGDLLPLALAFHPEIPFHAHGRIAWLVYCGAGSGFHSDRIIDPASPRHQGLTCSNPRRAPANQSTASKQRTDPPRHSSLAELRDLSANLRSRPQSSRKTPAPAFVFPPDCLNLRIIRPDESPWTNSLGAERDFLKKRTVFFKNKEFFWKDCHLPGISFCFSARERVFLPREAFRASAQSFLERGIHSASSRLPAESANGRNGRPASPGQQPAARNPANNPSCSAISQHHRASAQSFLERGIHSASSRLPAESANGWNGRPARPGRQPAARNPANNPSCSAISQHHRASAQSFLERGIHSASPVCPPNLQMGGTGDSPVPGGNLPLGIAAATCTEPTPPCFPLH